MTKLYSVEKKGVRKLILIIRVTVDYITECSLMLKFHELF